MREDVRSTVLIGLTAIVATVLLVALEEPMDPDRACCDHLFYRAQSVAWVGLDQPEALSIPAGNRLEQVYDEYYYDRANGLTRQPPYVYRVAVPLLAGVLGGVTGVDTAYRILHDAVLAFIALVTGLSVLQLTRGSLVPALAATVAVLGIPQMARSFADNYMIVDPASVLIVGLVLLLSVRQKLLAASLVAALVAPLVKETLIPLGASVAVAAWYLGQPKRLYWVLAAVPVLIQAMLRILISVPDRPAISEMFVIDDPFLSASSFVLAFAPVIFLIVGLAHRDMRPWLTAFLPLAIGVAIITTSAVADGARIWLTFWPVLLVVGISGLWLMAETTWFKLGWAALLPSSAAVASLAGLRPDVAALQWLAALTAFAWLGLLFLQCAEWRRKYGEGAAVESV